MEALLMVLQGATFFAAAAVLVEAIGSINTMTPRTSHWIRVAYILIACGAFSEMFSMLNGRMISPVESAFIIGIGLLAVVDRRRQFVCPCYRGDRKG